MRDPIDRQAAITAICEDGTWLESQGCTEITMCERKQRDADILSELPTIDAVEVVRCKDCKFNENLEWWACPILGTIKLRDDDYCSFAERRTDAD